MSLNQIILMGNLITDPEMTYSKNGLAITKFRMQTLNEGGQSPRPPDSHSIVVFGKGDGNDGLAGSCAQFLHKGSGVVIQGRHQEQEFTARESGKTFRTCQIVAFNVTFMDKKSE